MNIAIILAAGSSTRTNTITPKQFELVNGLPVFMYSVKSFLKVDEIDELYVVCLKDHQLLIQTYLSSIDDNRIKEIILGGSSRQESVKNAIEYIYQTHDKTDVVLIHDSARPLVSGDIILRNIKAAKTSKSVTTAIKINDTIIESQNQNDVDEYKNRDLLFSIQTPQTFELETIYLAHQNAIENNIEATDDTKLVKLLGTEIKLVEGSKHNFKITTKEDLILFKNLLEK